MSVNKVILLGRLGTDPEYNDKHNVLNMSLGTDASYTDKNTGNKVEKTEWTKVEVWGKLATICSKFLMKGSQIYAEGRLKTKSYDDKEGNKRYVTAVEAFSIQFLNKTKKKELENKVVNMASPQSGQTITTDDMPF